MPSSASGFSACWPASTSRSRTRKSTNGPCPMGYAINSIEEAKKISKVRLQQWITQNSLLSEIGEEEDSLNNLTYYFRSATVYMLSAATTGDWQNKTIDIIFMDELDIHELHEGQGTTVDMARGRVKRSANSK